MLVKRMSCYITVQTPKVMSVAFTIAKNYMYLRTGVFHSLCSLLHRSISLCSSGFGSQQAIFSLAGGILYGSDKYLLAHITKILHKKEKPYTRSSQNLFLYTGILRATAVDGDYKHSLMFRNKYL